MYPMTHAPTAQPALRMGILGCAQIARAFARDVAGSPHTQLVAVASRQADKAEAFARDFGIPRHHASYEALLADAAVDAVYIPLPNSLHAPWAVAAARAGKHVLCEKPLALDAAEAEAMFAAATAHRVVLLESYPYWFQPQTRDLLTLLHGGAIGSVRSVQANFGFTLAQPAGNIRMDAALGGGALLDAGSYPMSLIRLVMGCAPLRVQAHARWAPTGVDLATAATLEFADGRHAQLVCAMDQAVYRHATIVGSDGVIETDYFNHTSTQPTGHPLGFLPSHLRVRRGVGNAALFEDVASATGSGFAFAAEAFARLVREQDFAAAGRAAQASIDIARSLQAIARSARLGQAVELPPTTT